MKKTLSGSILFLIAPLLLVSSLLLTHAAAAEKGPYKIGLTGALTGPPAVTLVPHIEGFRLYIERLNDTGGIGGIEVKLMLDDDRGEPPRAGSNVRKYVEQGVHLIINMSASSTFLPTLIEAKKANIPTIFGLLSPKEAAPPNPDPLAYMIGSSHTAETLPTIVPIAIKEQSKGPVKLGILGVDIPLSRIGCDHMAKTGEAIGLKTMVKIIPLGTVDITPVANEFVAWGADWIHFYGPGPYSITLFDAMAKMGSKVKNLHSSETLPFEDIKEKYKGNPNFLFVFSLVPLTENLPEHKEILAACEKYKVTRINSNLILGWEGGKIVAQILKRTGWPVTTEKLVGIMQNFEFDRRPLMGPLKWTPKNHVGLSYWRLYQFEGEKLAHRGPWFVLDPMTNKHWTVNDLAEIK